MTNYEKWILYTKNLPSPQTYIDVGFYFLICAALQRRVWLYGPPDAPNEDSLFPNIYPIFVGPPAVGKGLVLGRVASLLRHNKYEKGLPIATNSGPELPPLFPVGADATTFEELTADVATSCRKAPTASGKVYTHTSYTFVLEELSSLFRKKTEDVVKFLLNAFDCKGYEYKTKHQGKDVIRNLCLSFMAGTQLDFLQEAYETKIFGQGFSSRAIFIFEHRRRKDAFHIQNDCDEQDKARTDLLAHLKYLSTLYGRVSYDNETAAYLDDWYLHTHCKKELAASPRMADYMGRKKVHLLKLALGMHFAEYTNFVLPLKTIQRSIELLDKIEIAMETGLKFTGRNELHAQAIRVLNWIRMNKKVERKTLYLQFGVDLNLDEIEAVLKELEIAHGLRSAVENGKCWYWIQ